MIFDAYARYYDLLYQDKDYVAEVDFVVDLLSRYGVKTRSLLELGCGTGCHAGYLGNKGFECIGKSKKMSIKQL